MPRFSRYQNVTVSDYPRLRESLAPELRNRPAEDIEALFESYNLSAEDIEGFFDTLRDIGQAVVRVAPAILPVAGTVVGTAFGGPAGAALGGALGNLAGGAISQATAPRQPSPPTAPSPQGISSRLMGPGGLPPGSQIPGVPQAPPGTAPASGQLLQTMFRPEMIQALMQMLLGQLGGSNVRVGNTPVPVGAFTNLLGTLANQAQAEYNMANPSAWGGIPEYIRDYAGEAVGDPAVAEHRARALYEMLQETNAKQASYPHMRRSYNYAYSEGNGEDEVFYVELEPEDVYAEDEF